MSYHPNIPQATDDPTVSQSQLLNNFGKMNTDFAINHVALTAGGNNGFHKLVQFTNVLSSDPSVTGVQSALYPKNVDGNPQLFFRNTTQIYPLTGLKVINGTITGVITGGNTRVTSDGHRLATGNTVTILDVNGVTGINGLTFTITVVDANNFDLNAASAGAYINGGIWTSPDSTRFGFITPWGWTINCGFAITVGLTTMVNFSIPYSLGFDTYTALLTPESAVTQIAVTNISQTILTFSNSQIVTVYYLVIGTT